MADPLPELLLPDQAHWLDWLADNYREHSGVLLVLGKKGTVEPTSLRYDEALEVALCHGWIDGQVMRRDEVTYRQRFTPRRAKSSWSKRNVEIVERLIAEGRMAPAGLAAVSAAQADGRWEAAYPGSAEIEVPADLAAALAENPAAKAAFARLSAQNRYAILYRVHNTRRPDTRARRIGEFVAMLADGRAPHPQRQPLR